MVSRNLAGKGLMGCLFFGRLECCLFSGRLGKGPRMRRRRKGLCLLRFLQLSFLGVLSCLWFLKFLQIILFFNFYFFIIKNLSVFLLIKDDNLFERLILFIYTI